MARFVPRIDTCYHKTSGGYGGLIAAGAAVAAAVYIWDRYHIAITEALVILTVMAVGFAIGFGIHVARKAMATLAVQKPEPLRIPEAYPPAPEKQIFDAVEEVAAKVRERQAYDRTRELKAEQEEVVYVLRPDGVERRDAS